MLHGFKGSFAELGPPLWHSFASGTVLSTFFWECQSKWVQSLLLLCSLMVSNGGLHQLSSEVRNYLPFLITIECHHHLEFLCCCYSHICGYHFQWVLLSCSSCLLCPLQTTRCQVLWWSISATVLNLLCYFLWFHHSFGKHGNEVCSCATMYIQHDVFLCVNSQSHIAAPLGDIIVESYYKQHTFVFSLW